LSNSGYSSAIVLKHSGIWTTAIFFFCDLRLTILLCFVSFGWFIFNYWKFYLQCSLEFFVSTLYAFDYDSLKWLHNHICEEIVSKLRFLHLENKCDFIAIRNSHFNVVVGFLPPTISLEIYLQHFLSSLNWSMCKQSFLLVAFVTLNYVHIKIK
jgi:hypothetical protein